MKTHAPSLKTNHKVEETVKSTLQRELNILKKAPEDVKKHIQPNIQKLTNGKRRRERNEKI